MTMSPSPNTLNAANIRVRAIDPARLRTMRNKASDDHGNPWAPYPAQGWEPLRCCLRAALWNEAIVLISYAPFTTPSPWAEVGPVYVHAETCSGYLDTASLPSNLSIGPRVLRGYNREGVLLYDHVRLVEANESLQPALTELLSHDVVDVVHVRALATQCFTFAVQRSID